jgi:DNA-binding MarR family transcriptional regulator
MPKGDDRDEFRPPPAATGCSEENLVRFLRSGHVLRSLLREFLEEDFLKQVCTRRLTRSQFCLLKLVAAKADLQVGELARCLGVSPAASSKNLDRLERLGLVFRETSRLDRRVILLRASDEGRELVKEYERLKATRLSPVLDSLGEEKTALLCELLEEVCGSILESAEHPRATCLRCTGYYLPNCTFEQYQGECALQPRPDDGGLEA